jgi:ABC-2 type transport system permease protein
MEMVFIYAFYMIAISPMQILFDHAWQIRFHVQQGTFLKYYFRPLNMMFYYMSEIFDIKGITQLIVGVGLLIYASAQLSIEWTIVRIGSLLMTLLSASLVQISIIVSASCAAFWIIDSYSVLGLAWRLREFSPYPMTIFDGAFRFTFTYVIPIGFVAFYPSQLFLRPEEVSSLIYFSPIIGIGLFALTYWIWTKGQLLHRHGIITDMHSFLPLGCWPFNWVRPDDSPHQLQPHITQLQQPLQQIRLNHLLLVQVSASRRMASAQTLDLNTGFQRDNKCPQSLQAHILKRYGSSATPPSATRPQLLSRSVGGN